jgi:hypothetical protein
MRRLMMWWMRLVARIVFWSIVVCIIAVVWERGVERTVWDLLSWAQEVRTVWWSEYRRWEGIKVAAQSNPGAGGKVYGYGYRR